MEQEVEHAEFYCTSCDELNPADVVATDTKGNYEIYCAECKCQVRASSIAEDRLEYRLRNHSRY